ncbi:hypothetical protein MYX65_03340 [Acidobacteria bacterium AH-259-L09]|nr:hypothetical protein [Acidobacteria bacterium AH-259-L09]
MINCEKSEERMMDILYGEEVNPRLCFEFFRHLEDCPGCTREYLELLETREMLAQWKVEHLGATNLKSSQPTSAFGYFLNRIRWWPALQRIAAGFLIIVGVFSILQYMGYLGGQRLVVPEQQLTEMVHDMIVAQQVQERQLTLKALLAVKEDVELQQRVNFQELQGYLISLERRYVDNLEENNHYLRTLLSR